MFGIFSQVQGWVKLKGNSDGTKIGNNGDSLFVIGKATTAPLLSAPALVVRPIPFAPSTYSASITNLGLAATPSDVFTLTGSATKTIRINTITVTATQTTGAIVNVVCLRRSTANTLGGGVTLAAVSMDTNNPAATATGFAYNANPTVGTLVGNIRTKKLFVGATSVVNSDAMVFNFGINNGQPVTLRGANQVFAVNLNSVTVSGGSFNIFIEWTEE